MPTLLIVDDDPVDRELAARCVAEIDALEVIEAEHGEQALEICAESAPDVVVSDLRMPRMDGLALVEKMQARHPLVPVILMTARGSEEIAARALAAGAASYVPKRDLEGMLGEAVEQVLAVAASKIGRSELMTYIRSSRRHFELINDPALITPLVAFLQDELASLGFGDEQARFQIGTALHEALSNAMIHGNLEVSSDLRKDSTEPYHRLIGERQRAAPWSARRVHFEADQGPEQASYLVRDEGTGFDPSTLPDPTRPENMLKAGGRGLFLMNAFMDQVVYNDVGNEVRLLKAAPAKRGEAPAGAATRDG